MNIVITGASRGIGKAIALKFAQEKFNLAVCARTKKDLQKLEKEIYEINPSAEIFISVVDVSDKKQIQNFASDVLKKFKTIDVLVNNAGIYLPGEAHKEKDGTLEKLLQTNLLSAYYLTQKLIPRMLKQKRGHIFNNSSIAGINAYPNGGSYSISKFALTGFSKNLREEMKPHGICVTNICAGAVLTDTWKGTNFPDSRFMKPEDIAELVFTAWKIGKQSCVEEIVVRPIEGDI